MSNSIQNYIYGLHNDVVEIDISYKKLTSINQHLFHLSRFTRLRTFICMYCELTSLPQLPDSVEFINCSYNNLTTLPPLPPSLKLLMCYYNKIPKLPPLPPMLGLLDCSNNELTELTCLPASLIGLYCNKNYIEYIDKFPDNCKNIRCSHNLIEDMPLFPQKLEYLQCSHNKIKRMFSLPPKVYHIDCCHNLLESLPYIKPNIIHINCDNNPISEILDTNPTRHNFIRYSRIKENITKLYKFKLCYYLLKYKQRFRELLWRKVREPKIKALYSPENIQNTMMKIQDSECDLDAVGDQDIIDKIVISIENGI